MRKHMALLGIVGALAAVATLHPAIEVPDSRYDDFTRVGAPQLIADNADTLAKAVSLEHGKTLPDAAGEVARGLENVEFATGEAGVEQVLGLQHAYDLVGVACVGRQA